MKEKIDFFKSYYENQHIRREKIYEQFFYFVGLLTIQIGSLGFYFLNFPTYRSEDSILYYFFIFTLLTVGGFIVKIFFIIYSWTKNKKYAEFAKPNDIKKYIDNLESYDKGESNDSFDKYLLNEYVSISDFNTTINENRHSLNMSLRTYLIIVLYSLLFSFIPYFYLMGDELNSQKIIILDKEVETKIKIPISLDNTININSDLKEKCKKTYTKKVKRDRIMINLFNCSKKEYKKEKLYLNDIGFIIYQSVKDSDVKRNK